MTDATLPSPLERDHLLNDNAAGERVGEEAVAMLTPVPAQRIPRLRLLLRHPDIDVVLDATLMLVAWGDEVGLNNLEELVDRRVHTLGEFYPHRLYGYDNVYDILGNALGRYGRRNNGSREQRQRVFEKLLHLYGTHDFEGWFKSVLLESDFPELQEPIEQAITRALALGKPFLASDLLAPLARFSEARALARFPEFKGFGRLKPNPEMNVAEALSYVSPSVGTPLLQQLARHRDQLVAREAQKSLGKLAASLAAETAHG